MTTDETQKQDKVAITFNGESIGHILVEWIGLVESILCEDHHMQSGKDYHKELFIIDSASIIHEHIEKGSSDFRNVTQMAFEVKDGFFKYEARNDSDKLVKSFMIPLKYLHTIHIQETEVIDSQPEIPMHKLSTNEKKSLK